MPGSRQSICKNQVIFVLGGGRQWRPVVHVRDAARAFALTMAAPAGRA